MAEYGINGTSLNLEHLVLKANSASAWAEDYVLLAGELGIELDTKKYKMGDGTTQWKDLAYYTNPAADTIVNALTERVGTAESTIASHGTRLDTAESNITSHGSRLDTAESDITGIKAKDTAQDGRLDALEAITTISANPFRA